MVLSGGNVLPLFLVVFILFNSSLFSSNSDNWSTPQDLFDSLNSQYHFTLDVCALPSNAKCPSFYTPEDNGLIQPWYGVVWCNPPYGRTIDQWVKKAAFSDCPVVMLLPARTDTVWFHQYVLGHAQLSFIRGRLKFGNSKNSAPFPSFLAFYRC